MSRAVEVGSFDLLLDTITNAFGGILFLAILVVVLLRTSGHRELEQKAAELDELVLQRTDRQFAELSARRVEMRRALQLQARIIDDFAPDETRVALGDLNRSREQCGDLAARRDILLKTVQDAQREMAGITNDLESLDRDLEESNRRLAALRSSLEREIESRTTTARLPRARRTFKTETVVIVRYGRLYVPYLTASDRFEGRLNGADVILVREGNSELHITPKPYAGVPLTDANTIRSALSRKLSAYDPKRFYLCVAIWDDSFAQFELLKETLLAMDYEYRLIPVSEGEHITEGHVEDVLVQ